MASTAVKLSTKAVGSTVTLNVNGTAKDWIVVHQGNPSSSIYDESCNGTWLLMKDIYESRQWHSSSTNDYANSAIHKYLNGTFLGLLDTNIQDVIKQVKIPYRKGSGTNTTVTKGSSGLSAKIFLLSVQEVGMSSMTSYEPTNEGTKLDYFTEGTNGNNKRIAKLNGTATYWWLRSPYCSGSAYAYLVYSDGSYNDSGCSSSCGVRPALILSSDLLVSDDGGVMTNTPPEITSASGASGDDLGIKNGSFSIEYTVTDEDDDVLTVVEKLDSVVVSTLENVPSGTTHTFEVASGNEWLALTNGTHTVEVTVSDAKESVSWMATFSRNVSGATLTLAEPLTVEGDITLAILALSGDLPGDVQMTVEATNNANDDNPVWQDVTTQVKTGGNIVFDNTTTENGAAFNFRMALARGASDQGGYLTAVNGAFQ